MPSLTPFRFDSHAVRVIDVAGAPWFVAKDVAMALDYVWQPNLIAHVPEKWRGINPINTPYGEQKMLCLSEHGLYFFICRSDKPKALPFQEWLAGEVLPTIRRTGEWRGVTSVMTPSADLERLRAQRNALFAWLIELKPEIGKIARCRQAGLNRKEIARALGWGEKRVRLAFHNLANAGLLPAPANQLSLLEG